MPYGIGFCRGLGFRGYSPSWPYIGRGRGGLPRCWAYGSFYAPATIGWPAVMPETEINFLKNQAQILKQELDLIESRIREIEQKSERSG